MRAALVGATLAVLWSRSVAQYPPTRKLFTDTTDLAREQLVAQLRDHRDQENIYFPNMYMLPTDFYLYDPPDRSTEYTQNVIFDPCRGYEFDCCNDTFGTPEFRVISDDPSSPDYGVPQLLYDHGGPLPPEISRRPDDEIVYDETCTGEGLPPGRADCLMARIARRPPRQWPRCWNWNDTISADADCRAPADGSPLPLCMELGYTQTAYILECGGDAQFDPHCGTFLEVHRPGRADKLAETRLRGVFPSGYRMTALSTTYKRHPNRVLCWDPHKLGKYELWWVQRTLYAFIVQRRQRFTIVSPLCDWDEVNNRFLPYATMYAPDGRRLAPKLSGLDPFDPAIALFTRKRTEGVGVVPGKGMGGTQDPRSPSSFPPDARFDPVRWGDTQTYTFTPTKPLYTVRSGVLEPSLVEQDALRRLIAFRGYARLLAEGRHAEAARLVSFAKQEVGKAWADAHAAAAAAQGEGAPRRLHVTTGPAGAGSEDKAGRVRYEDDGSGDGIPMAPYAAALPETWETASAARPVAPRRRKATEAMAAAAAAAAGMGTSAGDGLLSRGAPSAAAAGPGPQAPAMLSGALPLSEPPAAADLPLTGPPPDTEEAGARDPLRPLSREELRFLLRRAWEAARVQPREDGEPEAGAGSRGASLRRRPAARGLAEEAAVDHVVGDEGNERAPPGASGSAGVAQAEAPP